MTTRPCHVCGSANYTRDEDVLDGHTLISSQERCGDCGYLVEFDTGNYHEVIGRWEEWWGDGYGSHPAAVHRRAERERRRAHARAVAINIRRHELGLLAGDKAKFMAAIAADPRDLTACKVFADWLDEHGEHRLATHFRAHDDPSGFVTCDACGGSGTTYSHSPDCQSPFCALAGGPDDCQGEVVPCECRE